MKKKPPGPAPAPAKAPDPPAKEAAPPQAEPKPIGDEKKAPEAATPVPAEQGKDLSEVPVQSPDKKAADPEAKPDEQPSETPQSAPEIGPKKKLATKPADPIDWFAMRQPFLNRGVPLTPRDGDQIVTNWMFTYNNMTRLGFDPVMAGKIANFGTPIAYDMAMKRDNPTQIEKFDAETEKMLPAGKGLNKIVVPIITSDSLSWMVEKTTGKKIEFRF